jgi:general secretion pathway protein G
MLLRREMTRQTRAAFTLMEMLVVVAIIVALAGVGGYFLLGQMGNAQKEAARAQAKGPLSQACKTYFINHNTWPDSLQQLTQPDPDNKVVYLESEENLKDPWGQVFQYDRNGPNNKNMQPDIFTKAPDGEIIGNWPKKR